MKLLVPGGAGFIGSAVIRQAITDGHDVVNIDKLTYAANLESLRDFTNSPQYSFENVDICDKEEVDRVFSEHAPQGIMHLAAESHVDRSIDGPDAFMQTNIIGTFNLLQAARKYRDQLPADSADGFRFHHVSTD